jgi:hypothetical protein
LERVNRLSLTLSNNKKLECVISRVL